MKGKVAWVISAKAFETSRNERYPEPLRKAYCRLGSFFFWTALVLEGRALEVWREQRAERPAATAWSLAVVWSRWRDGLNHSVSKPVPEQLELATAWSLPDSRRIRGLGLGSVWAVYCPFCCDYHTHSPGEDTCVPHCCSISDGRRYQLQFAGPLPVEHRVRFYLSTKAGWPWLLHQWPHDRREPEPLRLLAA
jgi:hypothetical protein